jgi:Ca-activated chloride channel family protein
MKTWITTISTALLAGSLQLQAGPVNLRIELDRSVLPANQSNKAIIKLTLDAPRPPRKAKRPAVNLSIIIDKSGSMGGEKIKQAREAALEAVRRLNKDDVFSLITYDSQVHTVIPAQQVENTQWIEDKIRGIRSGGNTALFAGVSQGANEIRKFLEKNHVNRMILLSDGLANIGPQSPAELGRLGASLVKEGISVTTIGMGNDFNEDLMTILAEKSDGNNYFVETYADLPRMLSAELGDVLNVVAKKVTITIECQEDVRPLRIIGREGRVFQDRVEINLNQVYGGQEKYVLVEVEIPARDTNSKLHIATAKCSYQDVFSAKTARGEAACSVVFSDQQTVVDQSINPAVQIEYTRNIVAENRDKVIALCEDGKQAEAVAVLKVNVDLLNDGATRWGEQKFKQDAEEQKDQWEQLEKQGLTKQYRKRLRNDSYDDRNQQSFQSRVLRK